MQIRLCASAHLTIYPKLHMSNYASLFFLSALGLVVSSSKIRRSIRSFPAALCFHSWSARLFDAEIYPPPVGSFLFQRRRDTVPENAFRVWEGFVPEMDRLYPRLLRKKLPENLSGFRNRQPILQRAQLLSQADTINVCFRSGSCCFVGNLSYIVFR